ncbi:MAG: MBL fold metallo-hydrolase [Bacteroidota bacterium]
MELTFLGTGTSQGVPMIGCECEVCTSTDSRDQRLRTSVLIKSGHTSVVIDSGPDFRQQLLRERVRSLDAVIFTHEHKDHIAGLDDVRAFNFFSGKPMDVYATDRVQEALRREFAYVFTNDTYPGIPRINLHTIHQVPFQIGDLEIKPFDVLHLNLPVTAFRIGDLCYITDANFLPESADRFIEGCKVLVLNALRRQKHVSHFTLDEALELVRKYRPERTFFTHISHQLGLHKDVELELPAGVKCAYDGLSVTI